MVGYGNEENKPIIKTEIVAPRRSPISRRSPMRPGSIVNPETGAPRASRRPIHSRRVIHPQASTSQAELSYHPPTRSPLVPSIGPISEVLSRAQRVLGRAHATVDALLQRQYIPRPIVASRESYSHSILTERLACTVRFAHDFRRRTVEQITRLLDWERNVLRGDTITPNFPAEFEGELEAMIDDCHSDMQQIRQRLALFESWPRQSQAGIVHSQNDTRRNVSRGINSTVLFDASNLRRTSSQHHRRALPHAAETELPSQFEATEPRPPTELRNGHLGIRQELRHDDTARQRLVMGASSINATTALPNGLGDRTRSASPENDAEAWNTMRMTLEPDDRLPSADSSFTTAAASASFSAPIDRYGSESAAISVNTSRTSVSVEAEEDCVPDHSWRSPIVGPLHEIPAPLFRDMDRQSWNEYSPAIPNLRLPPRSDRRNINDASRLSAQPPATSRSADGFMFSAPRSQSPLSFVSNAGVSTGPTAFDTLETQLARDGPLPSSQRVPDSAQPLSPDSDVSAIMRLAFRYAAAVASSSDAHADPELEHLRRMFSTVANTDGQLNEGWWMSAGVASYLAEDVPDNDDDSAAQT